MIPPPPAGSSRRVVRGLVISIALNALVPVVVYRLAKRYLSAAEVTALGAAALFPLGLGLLELSRTRTLDPVAIVSLMSIAVSIIAVTLGGSPKLLLIRESFFTGAFGIACLASLAFPRPIMFYFGRHFAAGRDPASIAEFDSGWQRSEFRRVARLITVVWGVASLVEVLVRVALVYTLPPAAVLVVSPIILGALLIATIVWTFAYVRRMRARAVRRPVSD